LERIFVLGGRGKSVLSDTPPFPEGEEDESNGALVGLPGAEGGLSWLDGLVNAPGVLLGLSNPINPHAIKNKLIMIEGNNIRTIFEFILLLSTKKDNLSITHNYDKFYLEVNTLFSNI
jgi:hypothetical protein